MGKDNAYQIKRRAAKQAEAYESRIAHQRDALDRLVAANMAYTDALTDVRENAKNVKEARSIAKKGLETGQEFLTVEGGLNASTA